MALNSFGDGGDRVNEGVGRYLWNVVSLFRGTIVSLESHLWFAGVGLLAEASRVEASGETAVFHG